MQLPADRAHHIFRDAPGHLPDTPENRRLLLETATDEQYLVGVDQYGTRWCARLLDAERQLWVQVRGDQIRNGGINQPPKVWHDQTGFAADKRPQDG